MKTELLKIAQDLEKGTITEIEARKLLFRLLNVRFSLPCSDEDEQFMIECDIYPQIEGARIMGEDFEGVFLDYDNLHKLSDVLYRYVKSNEI